MLARIKQDLRIQEFCRHLEEGSDLLVEQLWDAPKAVLATLAQQISNKHLLIVTGGARESRLYDDFAFFGGREVVEFPAWETLPSEEIAPSPDIVGERYKVLRKVQESTEPLIILCPLQSCLQRLLPPDVVSQGHWTIKQGDEVPYSELIHMLEEMGFVKRSIASDKGEFAVRGGIIDLFPIGSPDPYRIEFFGDEVESIRIYDPVGQTSVRKVDQVELTLAREWELLRSSKELVSILDYLKEAVLIFDDLVALEDRYVELKSLPGAISRTFVEFEEFLEEASDLQKIYWTAQPIHDLGEVRITRQEITFPIFNQEITANRWVSPFRRLSDTFIVEEEEDLLHGLGRASEMGVALRFICTENEEKSLRRAFHDAAVPLSDSTSYERGYLSSGFVLEGVGLALVPNTELTRRYRVRRQKQRSSYHTLPAEYMELTPGDLVVHFHNGIGKYLGVEKKPNAEGVETEFLAIEYADRGKLYVPMTSSYLVSKYIGSKEERPTLHVLGSSKWARTRQATERAIQNYAKQLLEMHAQREIVGGFAFAPDSEEMNRFEEEFPYEETEDQLAAINAVKGDMCAGRPMDRLVCGDVGYGKTEVAMRAAMKAVLDGGKQVALLVPTTVLAMQHYDNFCDRMANFPINVGVLSRFRKPKEQKATIEGVKAGSVDILIGTHRMLSKDMEYKNLGLVIVDEEQRFGVRVKEKLRNFRAGCDSLTLTATPIPRTLYLSLMGARELSVINTPPMDRLPIKTIVSEKDDEKTKSALMRELARDGQAYVVHNRVETIYGVADRLQKMVPQARVVVGHGQMGADELDRVFHLFKSGEADILVATTIIENGVDIPNANTIIVEDAHRYGLADLYQMRGRVGRWNRRAYAYFLTPANRSLPEVSQKRLEALAQVGQHGGGMKIAMRDLEIRGAGNILGTEQSGFVSAIGFQLYCKLLKRTVEGMKGEAPQLLFETKLDFPQDARIPEEYIYDPGLRMEFYQRFGEALRLDEVDHLLEEMKDRFGEPPEPVFWLYHQMRLRVVAARQRIVSLRLQKFTLTIERKSGMTRTLLKPIKTPADLEEKVISHLI